MGKYDPLGERLRESRGREVRLSFSEIEDLLGADLPKGAREKRTWWANEDSGHAAAWTGAGFEAEVDLDEETVVYRRTGAQPTRIDQTRELFDTGFGQARELFATGADQVQDAWERIPRNVRRTAPWVLLGAAVLTVVGVFLQRGVRDRA
jgi:hypothetical protein